MKICKICKIEKDISCFSFRSDTNKYRNECKDCKSNYLKLYRKGNKNNTFIQNIDKTEKTCNRCGETKPTEEFIKQKKVCKICRSKYLKDYYLKNKETISEKSKERYNNNSEKIKEKTKLYSKYNRIKINKQQKIYKEKVIKKTHYIQL